MVYSSPIITLKKSAKPIISLKLEIEDCFCERLPYNFQWNRDEDGNIVGIYYIIKPDINISESGLIRELKKLHKYYTDKMSS